jgi:AmmeMemoRadiSam system protein B/AmmeMemoRadiSam system protein A
MQRILAEAVVALTCAAVCGSITSCSRNKPAGVLPIAQAADQAAPAEEARTMRPTAVAGPGGFYTDDPERLRTQIEGFLQKAEVPELSGRIVAVMVPHAGYVYSGPVAAYSYKALQGRPISTVIILGNSHRAYFSGAALSPDAVWDCPLGPVEVDQSISKELLASSAVFGESSVAHAPEHSLEVQVPFIRTVLPEAKIVPILMGEVTDSEVSQVADALAPIVKRLGVLLVASSDMAHYPAYDAAVKSDKAMLEAIATLDPDRIRSRDREIMAQGVPELVCTLCGLDAVVATVRVANKVGVTKAEILKQATSGDTAGDKSRCVGYGAVAFVAPKAATQTSEKPTNSDELKLTEAEKRRLLKVARQTLEANFGLAEAPSLDPGDSQPLAKKTACFVTLKLKGRLRGCIGELEPREPLIKAVASRAIAAAEQDPRFMPVKKEELKDIAIEISAMSPLRKVNSPDEIIVGKHGVVVKQGFHSGVFLPQVAPEQGWDRDTMLSILCTEKAGLPADAWKNGAELWVFTANVFSEEEFGMAPPGSLEKR